MTYKPRLQSKEAGLDVLMRSNFDQGCKETAAEGLDSPASLVAETLNQPPVPSATPKSSDVPEVVPIWLNGADPVSL
ncbi:hypothetical protein D1872_317290 [compost metagenome]